jgi:hypothetical protein
MSLEGLVKWLRRHDAAAAVAAERQVIAAERTRGAAQAGRSARNLTGPGMDLGFVLPSGEPVAVPRTRALGHWGVWGPTGVGKSYALVSLLRSYLLAGVRSVWVLDPKAETVALAEQMILEIAATLPEAQAERLIDHVVVIEPFSTEALPPLQVLLPEPGSDPELQAWEVATLVVRAVGAEVGVRQEALLHRAIECLIRARLPLTLLPLVLESPKVLERMGDAEIFRLTSAKLARESRERIAGLMGRAERLLRLKSMRLMLGGAERCLDFGALLDDRIVLMNLAPPQGSADIGRFLMGLLWQKLVRAILGRPNGSPPAVVVLEEWPEFLSGGGPDVADSCERLLRLARSRGVFLVLLAQDLASVGRISASLPQVVRTNLHWHAIFRSTEDWRFALPVTGCRPRPAGPPWEPRTRGYLSRGEEMTALEEELAHLPDRECLLLERRSGFPAVRVRTSDLALGRHDAGLLRRRAEASGVLVPAAMLAAGEAAVRARFAEVATPAGDARGDATPAPRIRRRGGGPLDLG